MKILIIGGVAGGATVAARLRRLDEKAEIVLFERGEYVSYANCGLPYYIGGTIKERDRLFVQTEKGFVERFNIDIRTLSAVQSINKQNKTISICHLKTGKTYEESYDKLVISTGAEPIRPSSIPGIDDELIFTLRNVADTDKIKDFVTQKKPQSAVVVGAGFIGLEMVENLHHLGIKVDVVEMGKQVMAPLDFSMASLVHHELSNKGVHLLLEQGVSGFERKGKSMVVKFGNGDFIETDLVIWCIGVKPETQLVKDAGLKLGSTGGIQVNEYLQTEDSSIYALGDATEVYSPILNKQVLIPLAGPANKQGRIVANNIIGGNHSVYKGSIGTSIAKIFDLTVAAAGVSAKVLKREQIPYISSFTHGASHAGYYPNALSLSIKIVFSPSNGQLLGAQVVGYQGVDKRIEMLAQIIQNKGTIYDLMELEHAYAPPYSSAKDPVNMAGFVADNILSSKMKIIHWSAIEALDLTKTQLIDVRTPSEYALSHIQRAINIPIDTIRERLLEIDKQKEIVVYCAVGLRGYLASNILVQLGYENVRNLSGGFKTYHTASRKIINARIDQCKNSNSNSQDIEAVEVDACGLQCPGPVIQLKKEYDKLEIGASLVIKATDHAFGADVQSWCNITGAKLLSLENKAGVTHAYIQKQVKESSEMNPSFSQNKTMVVFSDDLDKALASFVIANGIASTGQQVTMFFTFWGLSVIKKKRKPSVKKDFMAKMFSFMLPSNSSKLKLSKMNMGGLGSFMMRTIMKSKNIESLETLMEQAIASGVEMIACSMSMDVMGVHEDELIDQVKVGGVAAYLERTSSSNLNLFI